MQLIKYHNFDIQSEVQKQIFKIAWKLTNDEMNELILNDLILMAHDESNEENVSRLLPHYFQKSEDKSSWHVRRACVVLNQLRLLQNKFDKMNCLIKCQNFSKIKTNGLKHQHSIFLYNSFIHCMIVIKKMNNCQMNIVGQQIKDVCEYFSSDQEIFDACAASFHQVVEIFGQDKWPNLLKLLQSLVQNKGVRKILAENLYIIANSCGPRNAEKDLVIILDSFLKDLNDEVKYAASKIQGNSLKYLMKKKGIICWMQFQLSKQFSIQSFKERLKKWRIRHLIAKQIKNLVPLYSVDNIFQIIVPITLKLCNDIVATVRKQAAKEMYSILYSLNTEDETSQIYYQCLIENIKAYGISHRFNQRQAYYR